MSSVLIAYFSRAGENYTPDGIVRLRVGNTACAASLLEQLTGADVFKITPKQPYDDAYSICVRQAAEQLRSNARPPLAVWPQPEALQGLHTLLLCYPNYCGTMPMPVWTFLQHYRWEGCAIAPLCTHEGGGLGRSEADIAALCPGARLLPGLAVRGTQAAGASTQLRLWLLTNGIALSEE